MCYSSVCLRSYSFLCSFFFNDTPTTEIYTLSLHDALPIFPLAPAAAADLEINWNPVTETWRNFQFMRGNRTVFRSEEHTSELQSRRDLVCRLLLEKKKKTNTKQLHNTKTHHQTRHNYTDIT